jgi:hypothetical protein
MWKQCLHSPTMMGQSSPGNLHLLHVPSKLTRQIPHVSSDSSGRSHFHVATARKELIVTFMVGVGCEVLALTRYTVLSRPCLYLALTGR